MPAKKNKKASPALTNPIFTDADKAREHLEAMRWPDGAFCPHCGDTENVTRMDGAAHRKGLHNCRSCRKQFSVTVGTLFERSHIPLNKWLLAFHLMAASKKGMSAHQMHRQLDITYKTAWFMCHRIREAMKDTNRPKLGGEGKVVEADETFFGTRPKANKYRSGHNHLNTIVALVERDGGSRAFHVARVSGRTVAAMLDANADKASHLMTDEAPVYKKVGKEFTTHHTTKHKNKQYSRQIQNPKYPNLRRAHSNTVEGFFSILKRGLIGTYHHVGSQHLGRYVNEFDFRYNHRRIKNEEGKWVMMPDAMRAEIALQGITGKRLTYRRLEVH